MKRLLLSDLHGSDPRDFIEEMIRTRGIEHIGVTGDIESPEITEYLLTLDFPKSIVIGNHDYPYIVDCNRLLKGGNVANLKKPSYLPSTAEEYLKNVRRWSESRVLREYASGFVASFEDAQRFQRVEILDNERIVFVHAGIFDEIDSDYDSDHILFPQLWTYMNGFDPDVPINITGNLDMMKDPTAGFWIMFRGHDHQQTVISHRRDSQRLTDYKKIHRNPSYKLELPLSREEVHMVSIGTFSYRKYGLFDDKTGVLELDDDWKG
jgi:hypothetical protein